MLFLTKKRLNLMSWFSRILIKVSLIYGSLIFVNLDFISEFFIIANTRR